MHWNVACTLHVADIVLTSTVQEKIEIIAKQVYRASGVEYLPEAEAKVQLYTAMGFDKLPICMAKTQYSFSHDAAAKGAPEGFVLPIRCVGAIHGFVTRCTGISARVWVPGFSTRWWGI